MARNADAARSREQAEALNARVERQPGAWRIVYDGTALCVEPGTDQVNREK
ncbi:MAG: hypothetical protein AB7K24_24375 [Gemmataceae bacterium]